MISTLAISSYRSLRELAVPLGPLNLVTGPNGSGKSNLYRALRLLADIAQGRIIPSLAREGGLHSTLWAGPESFSRGMLRGEQPVQGTVRKQAVSLRLGFAADDFGYTIDLGLPKPGMSIFPHDPEIKRECIWSGPIMRPSTMLVDRRGPLVRNREDGGEWAIVTQQLSAFDSMMTECADPRHTPEMLMLRDQIRGWRFYDQFRTDPQAPARMPQIGTYTPVLGNDGSDLAAALMTIIEVGDHHGLNASITDAFPGARVSVKTSGGWCEVEMQQQGLLRPLKGAELSDGTLRYLLWVTALLTPRPPRLLVLNEPETSLHPDLLPALARLIARTARESQVFVVSHAQALIDTLQHQPECFSIVLDKRLGETVIVEGDESPSPRWQWPAR